jgi:hypothetical protein
MGTKVKFKNLCLIFLFCSLAACGQKDETLESQASNIDEANEYKTLNTVQIPKVWENLSELRINYWEYAQRGEIDIYTAIQKSKHQVDLCKNELARIEQTKFQHSSNKLIWRSLVLYQQADCKIKESSVLAMETTDPIQRAEFLKDLDHYSKLSAETAAAYGMAASKSCDKFNCHEYTKIR